MFFIKRILFVCLFLFIFLFIYLFLFGKIFSSKNIILSFGITPFSQIIISGKLWIVLKKSYLIFFILSNIVISNAIFTKFSKLFKKSKVDLPKHTIDDSLHLYIGTNSANSCVTLCEKSLYQNILVTGSIGCGKTSSALLPFTKQLISYKYKETFEKLSFLILDVKGNFYEKVLTFANYYKRLEDVVVIDLSKNVKYNPLDKPELTPIVLANRLRTILELFSENNSDTYWLDKTEQALCEAIKFCRIYNNGYVNFEELHYLITKPDYYVEKASSLKLSFQENSFSSQELFDLSSCLDFFQNEFFSLDQRTLCIIQSEITRITFPFVSDFIVKQVFSPKKDDINFLGFTDAINSGKIVVLNLNISKYRSLSKIIAAYLKLDFQSEVLNRLSMRNVSFSPTVFISDEYHEYITKSDADFFAQSREAKCINIVATQSYSSLLCTLKNQDYLKVIIQNLVNKLWFRTDDIFTIENIQKQIGKENKTKISKSISENAQETKFSYLTNSLNSNNSSIAETISTYSQFDYIYDTNFFSRKLETFHCLAFMSDGFNILEPQKLFLKPYFN